MSWAVGYDDRWKRDIGYGVPSLCDHPGCGEEIDRGLGYVCTNGQPHGGNKGCGLYFCGQHRGYKCSHKGFTATSDQPEWIAHKLTDESWKQWRDENPDEVARLLAAGK